MVQRIEVEVVLKLGIAPSEYDGLTDVEVDAFVQVANDLAEQE